MEVIAIIASFFYFFVILYVAQKIGKNLELSRKFAHIMIGNWYVIAILLFRTLIHSLIVPAFFAFLSIYSICFKGKANIITSLLRKEQGSGLGIILFPISLMIILTISFINYNSFVPGGIGVMALTYGDSAAALIGKKFPILSFSIGKRKKTLSGCMAMFFFSMISILAFGRLFYLYLPVKITFLPLLFFSITAVIVEMITPFGIDNLSIPVSIFIVYMLLPR